MRLLDQFRWSANDRDFALNLTELALPPNTQPYSNSKVVRLKSDRPRHYILNAVLSVLYRNNFPKQEDRYGT